MLDLETAIKHCEEVAEKNESEANFGFGNVCIDRSSCLECAKEHRQLATWLEELKALKEQTSDDCISRKATLKAFFDYVGSDTRMNDYDDLCIIVSNMSPVTPQSNKWIAISKETPKEKGEYITTTMYGEVYCDYWDGDRFDRTETVVAWQEKPLPYRAESEGKKMNGSFELTFNNPLTEEDWDKIRDVELENTPSVTFKTPKGKQVKYIKADILDKIKKEIEEIEIVLPCVEVSDIASKTAYIEKLKIIYKYKDEVLKIIDKYKKESEG